MSRTPYLSVKHLLYFIYYTLLSAADWICHQTS